MGCPFMQVLAVLFTRSAVWLEAPDRMRVRGYWGPFYRTQAWRRSEDGGEGALGVGERPAGRR